MKKVLIAIAGLLLIVAVLFAVARHLLLGYLTPENVVREIESQWNCRAHIDGIKAHLLGQATVEIEGLALGPRDEHADKATPLGERPPMEKPEIESASVLLDVRLADLLQKRLNISRLIVTQPVIRTQVQRDGRVSLERLFDSIDGAEANPAVAPVVGEVPTTTAAVGNSAPAGAPPSPLPPPSALAPPASSPLGGRFSAIATQVDFIEGRIEALIEISGTRATVENFTGALTAIDIDTGNLAAHNQAAFQFAGDLRLDSPEGQGTEESRLLSFKLSGQGQLVPMDPATGAVDPSWVSDLTLHEGSSINTLPLATKLQEQLSGLGTGGIDLGDLRLSGDLLADTTTRIRYARGRYELEQPLVLPFPDTEIAVAQTSWFDTGKNLHQIQGQVTASQELSAKIEAKVDHWLERQGLRSDRLRKMLFDAIKKDGRISIRFVSEGDLKHPKADIVTPLGNLTDVIRKGKETLNQLKDVGKKLLENLFQNQ